MVVKKKKSRVGLWVLLLFILGVFLIFYFRLKNNQVYRGEPATIRLALAKIEATTMIRLARHNDFFKKHGIKLEIVEKDLGKDCLNELFNNRVDLATVAESPIAKAAFTRDDFLILTTIHTATRNVKIIAHRSSGINKITDLRGKKIGTSFNTVGEFFLYDILKHMGLSFDDITLVDGNAEELKEKFLDKKIDAISLREPHIYRLSQKLNKNDVLISYGKDNFLATFNIVGNKNYVRNNPEVVKRFLQALYEAETFLKNNKKRVMKLMSNELNLDMDYLHESCLGSECKLQLTQRLLLKIESEASWLIDQGLFSQKDMPKYIDYFELDLLESIKPGATQDFQ